MARTPALAVFFFATFLQAGAYGLTFLMPPLFAGFGGDEQDVGLVLLITTLTTLGVIVYSGHITELLGRMRTIGLAGVAIASSLLMLGLATDMGAGLMVAGGLLGLGWGLFYTLTPVVLTTLIQPGERVRVFTLLSLFMMMGFGLSPVLGATLEGVGWRIAEVFLLMAALCLVSAAIFLVIGPTIDRLALDKTLAPSAALNMASLLIVLRSRALVPIVMIWLAASVFAGVTNFQTVYAAENGLNYSHYFLTYTATVVACRILLAGLMAGHNPYGLIAVFPAVMILAVLLLLVLGGSQALYILAAVLFGIGYGAAYPVVKAVAANDAAPGLTAQTLQVFGFSYFVGVFGFPFIAGTIITLAGISVLLAGVAVMAGLECALATRRYLVERQNVSPAG